MKPLTLALAALCLFTEPVHAQHSARPSTPTTMASAHASLGARATRMRAETVAMFGGDVRFDFGWHVSIGGAGWLSADAITIPGESTASDLALDVSYGGVLLERDLRDAEEAGLVLRLMLGAGNAKVRLPVVDTEIAADNFGVIEPELGYALSLGARFEVRALAAYRLAFGVEDLPRVSAGDLRGASLSVSLVVGPF